MASKSRALAQDYKSKLKVLKGKGLYSGDLRKAPTDYAKRLTRQYSDVVSGNAQVITVARHATSKHNKGIKAARAEAKSLADAYSLAVRNKGAHLIVKTVTPEDKVRYSAKKHLIQLERSFGPDRVERVELRKHMEMVEDEETGEIDLHIRNLRDGESYAVPFGRGRGGIQYIYFGSKAELMAMINEYKPKWLNVADYVSISRITRNNKKSKPSKKRPRK